MGVLLRGGRAVALTRVALLMGASFPPISAMAQTAGAQPELSQPATALPAGAEAASGDIVVTAQKRSQTLVEVPLSVSVLPAAVLERQAVQEIRQLVQISPSVTFSEGSGDRGASFNIRGLSSTAQEGGIQPSTALVIDGVPIARQAEFLSNFADIEQIEVLAGPQGTLFGKNATAGVINIRTKNPTDRLEVTGEGSVTTDAEVILKSTVNVPLAGSARLRLNAFYDNQPGILHNVGSGIDQGGAKTYAFSGKLAVDLGSDVDLLLAADYRNRWDSYGAQIVLVPVSGAQGAIQRQIIGVPIGRGNDNINLDAPAFSKSEGWSGSGTLTGRLSDRLTLTSISAYRRYKLDGTTDLDSGPTGWKIGVGFSPNPLNYPVQGVYRGTPRIPFDAEYYSQELRANYQMPGLDLIVGGFYQHYREDFTASSPFILGANYRDTGILTYRYKDDSIAAFADATVEIIDAVKAFGGLRYTSEKVGARYARTPLVGSATLFNPVTGVFSGPAGPTQAYDAGRTDQDVSGRAGLQYVPDARTNYYISFNRGFKGAAMDVGSAWSNGARIFADPEIATSFEVGTRQKLFDNKLFFSIALYSQLVKNIQQATTVPGTINVQLQNAGDLRSRGAEFQLSWKATPELTFGSSAAYTHARYRGAGVVGCNVSQRAGLQGGCTNDSNGDGVADSQLIAGHPAKETPEFVFNLSLDYDHEMANGMQLFGRVGYVWIDKIQYQLINDPLTIEPSHGLLDASIGIETANKRLRFMVFAKNLTNEFYYGNLGQTDGVIARSWGRVARDAKRYGGVSMRLAL